MKTCTSAAALRKHQVLFAVVPWDAAIDPGRLKNYVPSLDSAHRYVELPDQLHVEAAFRRHPEPAGLFQKDDSHLSPAGAEFFAREIAAPILQKTSANIAPSWPPSSQ